MTNLINLIKFVAYFCVTVLICAHFPARGEGVKKTTATINIPAGMWSPTPYFDGQQLILHLQKKTTDNATEPRELLFDALTGREWNGDLSDFLSGNTERLYARGDEAYSQIEREYGCERQFTVGCSFNSEGTVGVFIAYEKSKSILIVTTVNARVLASEMTQVLEGKLKSADVKWSNSDWRVLSALAKFSSWREEWIAAMRAVKLENLQQLSNNFSDLKIQSRLHAGDRSESDDLINSDQLEIAMTRAIAAGQSLNWMNSGRQEDARAIAEFGSKIMAPPYQIRLINHVIDQITQNIPLSDLRRLSDQLLNEARKMQSEDVYCLAKWVMSQECGSERNTALTLSKKYNEPKKIPVPESADEKRAETNSADERSSTTKEKKNLSRIQSDKKNVNNKINKQLNQKFDEGPEKGDTAAKSNLIDQRIKEENSKKEIVEATQEAQEIAAINSLPNKAVLISFSEATGKMSREQASLSGLTFIARAVGALSDGRVEIQVVPSSASPVRLSRGRYKIKVSFQLDYTREDSCSNEFFRCLLSRSRTFAKTLQEKTFFYIAQANRYTDKKTINFGSLLTVTADGGAQYKSQLMSARLSVKEIRLDIQ